MKSLVVYESLYGNTRKVAEAIGGILEQEGTARVVPADEVEFLDLLEADLLVIGCPTHRHGVTPAMRAFLNSMSPSALESRHAIMFDTRYYMPTLLSGSAAKLVEKTLKALGYKILLPHESFFVTAPQGPLAQGEFDRAIEWARVAVRKMEVLEPELVMA